MVPLLLEMKRGKPCTMCYLAGLSSVEYFKQVKDIADRILLLNTQRAFRVLFI